MIPRLISLIRLHESKILLTISFVAVFVLGFFTGRIDAFNALKPVINITKSDSNSTIFNANEQLNVLGQTDAACAVKGNSSSRIYHVPGGSYYATLRSPVCFATELDAQAAGYRKSQR